MSELVERPGQVDVLYDAKNYEIGKRDKWKMNPRPNVVVAVTLNVTLTVGDPVDGVLQTPGTVNPAAPQLAGLLAARLLLAVKSDA